MLAGFAGDVFVKRTQLSEGHRANNYSSMRSLPFTRWFGQQSRLSQLLGCLLESRRGSQPSVRLYYATEWSGSADRVGTRDASHLARVWRA